MCVHREGKKGGAFYITCDMWFPPLGYSHNFVLQRPVRGNFLVKSAMVSFITGEKVKTKHPTWNGTWVASLMFLCGSLRISSRLCQPESVQTAHELGTVNTWS